MAFVELEGSAKPRFEPMLVRYGETILIDECVRLCFGMLLYYLYNVVL